MSVAFLAQLRAFDEGDAPIDFARLTAWMRTPRTSELLRDSLASVDALPPADAPPLRAADLKALLAALFLALDGERTLDPTRDADVLIGREAARFHRRLCERLDAALRGDGATRTTAPPFGYESDTRRMLRFYLAWARQDQPHTVESLMASVMARRAREAEAAAGRGEEAEAAATTPREGAVSPGLEETFTQIRLAGGADAEAEARRRYAGEWRVVRGGAEGLQQRVAEVARRAFWDATAERVAAGDYEALFGRLEEVSEAMRALVAHSERAVDELKDVFDVALIRQQVEHGALDAASVRALMRFVASKIVAWQAPADAPAARAWADRVEADLDADAAAAAELDALVGRHLLPFLERAHGHLGQIYARVLALADAAREEQDGAAAAPATADSLAAQD